MNNKPKTFSELQQMSDACVHCGKCTENCAFLKKYDLDLGDVSLLREHLRSCFLCGKCDEVCPVGIKGSEIFKELRRQEVASGDADLKPYSFVLKEKQDYKFRNYRNATKGSVLFPGCNFPSLFPKTNKYLEKLLKSYGIGTVYDCCGKPIAELGLYEDEQRIIQRITSELEAKGVEEIVTMCPNCYYFLKDRIPQKVTSIYSKLVELGVELKTPQGAGMYIPCPDRESEEWTEEIRKILGYSPEPLNCAQCCGLGGMASAAEPEMAKAFGESLPEGTCENTTFCASCAGQFARNGRPIRHILSLMLGIEEAPATKTSYLNRVMTKFK